MNTPAPRPVPPPNRRRDKPQSVCNSCRKGKLRCDRAQPCGHCTRRGLGLACTYVNSNAIQKRITQISAGETDLADRVKQLEKLITSMIPGGAPAATNEGNHEITAAYVAAPRLEREESVPLETAETYIPVSTGLLKQDNRCTTYVGGTHWTAILDEIQDVKLAIDGMQTQNRRFMFAATVSDLHEPDILFGNYPRLNKQQLIEALPARATVDMLVADYFNNKCIESVIVHKHVFFSEYGKFWEKPTGTSTSIIWISQLYAITALSAQHQDQPTPLLPDPMRVTQVHKEKIIQGLTLASYLTCPALTIETLLILHQIETLRTSDSGLETSLLLAMIIKLATRQGYHRDASSFPSLTTLEGEMRRRVWHTILALDFQSAIQTGLPRTLRLPFHNTCEPRNLLDNDFHTDDEMLPLARAETVNTPVQYLVLKSRLLAVYGNILDLVSSASEAQRTTYNDILTVDMSLHNAFAQLPLGMRMYPIPATGEITIPIDVVVRRIYLALIFEAARCTLHHHFVGNAVDKTSASYTDSQNTSIEAALEILTYQHLLEDETRPRGRLYQERWRIDPNARHAFLLASSVLCHHINATTSTLSSSPLPQPQPHYHPSTHSHSHSHSTFSISALPSSPPRPSSSSLQHAPNLNPTLTQKITTALTKSHTTFARLASTANSVDALKASKAIELTLNSLSSHGMSTTSTPAAASDTSSPASMPTPESNRHTGLASIHSLLMQNAGVDYRGIEPRRG